MSRGLQTLNSQNKLALWSERIQSCCSSGMSVKDWCRENGDCEQTYYRWQRKLFELTVSQSEPVFVEMPVRSNPSTAATIVSGELSIDIHHGADSETIFAIVRALKQC